MQATFSIYRKQPGQGSKPGRSTYTVELADDATVMDALLKIRDEQDPTLGFRGSCLHGYCGDCTVRVNGKSAFTCTAKVAPLAGKEIGVEPIRNMPVVKDLISDWDAFLWDKIDMTKPWLEPNGSAADGELQIDDKVMARVRQAMSCHYCGLCDEGCTVLPVDFKFVGPAALTKASRFLFDPRDQATTERLHILERPKGIWDCVHCFEASEHCPREIAPTERIMEMRDEAFKHGISNDQVARHHHSFAASVKRSGWLDEGRLALESEGLTNVKGLMKLLPTAAKAIARGKAPIPYLHHKRPGADKIARIIDKAEAKEK
ncbi:MAG TPA: succinate dehydrogenase/fumarate reductase iron-sulfur subunit [Candidatus Binataceae bacterium]|nr:succinate dehydrogenase/fumarate reductase iron-sulfur subunit [Candidatus Binataceae bacterium]